MPADQQAREESQKRVAHYQEMVGAWVGTRMETDRTLLALSAGGIGLLVTLLTTLGPRSECEAVLYKLAGASFFLAIVAGISILKRNSKYLERVVREGRRGNDPLLVILDRVLLSTFLLGVLLSGAIALSSDRDANGGLEMTNDQNTSGPRVPTERSLTGAGNLAPTSSPPVAPAADSSGSSSGGGSSDAGSGGGGQNSGGGGGDGGATERPTVGPRGGLRDNSLTGAGNLKPDPSSEPNPSGQSQDGDSSGGGSASGQDSGDSGSEK